LRSVGKYKKIALELRERSGVSEEDSGVESRIRRVS